MCCITQHICNRYVYNTSHSPTVESATEWAASARTATLIILAPLIVKLIINSIKINNLSKIICNCNRTTVVHTKTKPYTESRGVHLESDWHHIHTNNNIIIRYASNATKKTVLHAMGIVGKQYIYIFFIFQKIIYNSRHDNEIR